MKKKLLSLGLALFLVVVGACGKESTPIENTGPEISKDGVVQKQSSQKLQYVTSNAELNYFLNDFFDRQVGVGGKKAVELDLGQAVTAWKEWEAMSLMWFDSTDTGGLNRGSVSNGYAKLRSDFRSIPIDRYGYIWATTNEDDTPDTANSYTYFDQGWPFPSFEHGTPHSFGNNFNSDSTANQTNYEVEGAASNLASGNLQISPSQNSAEVKVTLQNTNGYAFFTPFIEAELKISNNEDKRLEDLYIEWKVAGGQSYSVSYAQAGTQQKDVNEGGHFYFNMSEMEGWGRANDVCKTDGQQSDRVITEVSLVFRAKPAQTLNGLNLRLDFLRADSDDRCIQNNAIFINGIAEYYRYTGDDEFLAEIIGKVRSAYQFYLTYCNGKSGLINQDNFVGHDGLPIGGHGISSGYFDILALPSTDFYFNVYFYKATQSMAYLERMVSGAKIEAETTTVSAPGLTRTEAYAETEQSLTDRLSLIREKVTEEFWNAEKGRFVEGHIDWQASDHLNSHSDLSSLVNITQNNEIDYGFLVFNLEAVACGLASDSQAKLIMDWSTGQRNIAEDTATADAVLARHSLYYFECAPRISTKSNSNQYAYGGWASSQSDFGRQVQDGGSAMWLTYYDLMSRQRVYGSDNAYGRVTDIVGWYDKVTAAYEEKYPNKDNPTQFYRSYYTRSITLQGGGQAGGLGLDCEFLENAIVYAAFPKMTLGMDSTDYKVLNLAPSLPSDLLYYKMENLAFHGVKYDVTAGADFIRVSNVRDNAVGNLNGSKDGLSIKISLNAPSGKYTVMVDGKATSNYEVINGKIVLTLPFGNFYVKVQ